ncbi:MAG: hypothetical protein R2834_00315 [Rhodothermales bacterium]
MATDPSALIEALSAVADLWRDPEYPDRAEAVEKTLALPNTFTEEAVAFAINQQVALLTSDALHAWMAGRRTTHPRPVSVLNAGNIPFVELQDWLAVLLTGHSYRGTLSSRSPYLLPAFAAGVAARGVELPSVFGPLARSLTPDSAVIASGGPDALAAVARMAEERGIPGERQLLRGHRYSVALLSGREGEDELERLAEDTLLHEGRGCRNIAIIWAPAGQQPDALLEAFAAFRGVFPAHPKTPMTLKMRQAMLHAVGVPHAYGEDLSFLLSKGAPEEQEPGHVRWAEYESMEEVTAWLQAEVDAIQLVAASPGTLGLLPELPCVLSDFGEAQRPALDWRPDQVDTIDFLVRAGR